jgi:RecA/RadA recombinase
MTQLTQKTDILRTILCQAKIINIFGPSGSGKSTLAMSLLKSLHASDGYTDGKSFYIDTEKGFTTTRFKQIKTDQEVFTPDIKLLNSILATQPKNLGEQQKSIMEICNNKIFTSKTIPINAIVLDTASHLFRNRPDGETWTQYSSAFQGYYENHILPLRLLQNKLKCYLIFVHQVSWNPNPTVSETGQTRNFNGEADDDREAKDDQENLNNRNNGNNRNNMNQGSHTNTERANEGQNQPYLANIFQEIKPAVWVKLGSDNRVFTATCQMTLTLSDRPDFSESLPQIHYKIATEGLKFL